MSDVATRRWLAVIRIVAGFLVMRDALPRFSVEYLQGFSYAVKVCASGNPFPWFRTLLTDVVLPNQQVFALLAVMAQVLIGVALIIGFLSGLAALGGAAWSVLTLLATSHLAPGAVPWMPVLSGYPSLFALLLFAALFLLRAGRTWGVDARIGSSRGWLG